MEPGAHWRKDKRPAGVDSLDRAAHAEHHHGVAPVPDQHVRFRAAATRRRRGVSSTSVAGRPDRVRRPRRQEAPVWRRPISSRHGQDAAGPWRRWRISLLQTPLVHAAGARRFQGRRAPGDSAQTHDRDRPGWLVLQITAGIARRRRPAVTRRRAVGIHESRRAHRRSTGADPLPAHTSSRQASTKRLAASGGRTRS